MIVFEDAHWIDPTSRELLDLIVERVRTLRLQRNVSQAELGKALGAEGNGPFGSKVRNASAEKS